MAPQTLSELWTLCLAAPGNWAHPGVSEASSPRQPKGWRQATVTKAHSSEGAQDKNHTFLQTLRVGGCCCSVAKPCPTLCDSRVTSVPCSTLVSSVL